MADFVNTHLDRYLIQERIGTGGMARVFKAWDTNLDRLVAVKILHDHLADDPSFKERFEREAKFIASLNHPNIVQIYDFNVVERDGYPIYYMVMPLIKGQPLRQVVENIAAEEGKGVAYDRILELILPMADALGYAHNLGMVHRDVKPANILLNELGQPILTDFGIARLASSSRLTQEGSSTGTPAYMSPEQVSGLPGDGRSDLYALAVILFEMIAGRAPYEDEGGLSLMLKHLNAPIPHISDFLPTANPVLDEFIFKALAKEPGERYQSAQEFANDLQAVFLETGMVSALPQKLKTSTITMSRQLTPTTPLPTVPVPAIPPKSKRRWVIAGVSIATAFVILVIAVSINQQSSPVTQPIITDEAVSSMTGNIYFLSDFDQDDMYRQYWPTGTGMGGVIQEFTADGLYKISNQRSRTATTTIFDPDYMYSNLSISMTGTIEPESNPSGAFGIVFRYIDEDHYNVFAVDGMGRYSIWVRQNGEWRELRGESENWTQNDAILPLGNPNTLTIDVLGSYITGYVNGKEVTKVRDSTYTSGAIGIYMATHTEGITSVVIDNYQTYPVAPPSMTG